MALNRTVQVINFDQTADANECMLAMQQAIEPKVTEPLLPVLSPDGHSPPRAPSSGLFLFDRSSLTASVSSIVFIDRRFWSLPLAAAD